MAKIEIRNLRNISHLTFEIPDRGVWLLTAANGGGKTSLLGCIRRIGQPNAFPLHFPSSLQSDRLDNHAQGSVTYEVGGETVEYAYRGERWTPRPRSNSNLLGKLGYPTVVYIGANADRITPRPEDFNTKGIRPAAKAIIDGANAIFETEKFSQLKTINLTRGTGNDAFVLALGGTPVTYHSEKHFSLGELCVLKLLKLLGDLKNNSLVVVDELEMALHPRAQVNLLKYLQEKANAKRLTVIFSTHSVTLLKTIDRKRIIYLDKLEDGSTRSLVGCFPTYALGNIASVEESLPDAMIYVEDLFARDMTNAFFELFADDRYQDPTLRPTAKVVPVGGFQEVVAFLDRNRSVLPERVVQRAVLDQDVQTESLALLRQNDAHSELAKFQRVEGQISYLPFTPEVGLMAEITQNVQGFEQSLRQRLADNQIRIGQVIQVYDRNLTGGPQRSAAKQVTTELMTFLERQTQRSRESVREHLCAVFAHRTWQANRPSMMQLFGSIFR